MSDNTQNGANDILADSSEPSMEDILASIRRIIDEDEPAGMDADVVSDPVEPQSAPEDVNLSGDALSIEDILLEDDEDDQSLLAIPELDSETDTVVETIDLDSIFADKTADVETVSLTAGGSDEDPLTSFLDDLSAAETDDTSAALAEIQTGDSDNDVLDLEVFDMVEASDPVSLDSDISADPTQFGDLDIATDTETDLTFISEDSTHSSDSDIDLVKSLMADLTDHSFADELNSEAEIAQVAETFEDSVESTKTSSNDMDFMLDDVLDLSESDLDDSESLDALSLELDTVETGLEERVSDVLDAPKDEKSEDNLLLEIAAAARADATQIETATFDRDEAESTTTLELDRSEISDDVALHDELVENLIGEADDGSEKSAESLPAEIDTQTAETEALIMPDTVEDTLEAELSDVQDETAIAPELDIDPQIDLDDVQELSFDTETRPQIETVSDDETDLITLAVDTPTEIDKSGIESDPQESTNMAQAAVKTDSILDEVTESAAAGAFASLNQVVEEKTIKAERGDRIGDLVMEALTPMLKEWLDENLKGIVERAVTKEVKRIASGK